MSAPDQPLVSCRRAGRTYGSGDRAVVAVYGAECRVRAGERIAITGPSGSGKSTLLHLLAGLETPTTGSVEWPAFGVDAQTGPRRVSVVFQTPSLVPGLTVAENVRLPLLLREEDPAAARERADEALALLDLAGLRDSLPDRISGGQAQRAVVARVLAERPALVLADEPTSKLDRVNSDHVASVLLEAAREIGAALVVATHDPLVAERLDRTWPMHDGRLHASAEVSA